MDIKTLQAKTGELTLENDFFEVVLGKAGVAQRKTMINRDHELSVSQQWAAPGISRGSIY